MERVNIFKDYFKFPLKMWEFMDIKVFTDDNGMAFDWMVNCPREVKEKLLDVINGYVPAKFSVLSEFKYDGSKIVCKLTSDNETRQINLCLIRGWGRLTGIGGYNLDPDKAAEIQDAFAEYCVDKLNGK